MAELENVKVNEPAEDLSEILQVRRDKLSAMRENKIEPKRITFVHADTESEPSMALVEGKMGGKCGLLVTKPLLIYTDKAHKSYTNDMNYIMENGSFPSEYKR